MNTQIHSIRLFVLLLSFFYLLFIHIALGIGVEHISLILFYNICLWIHPKTQKLILGLSIFVIFGILYDVMKVYPNYLINNVDIRGIYSFEKRLFGIHSGEQLYTPNEFLFLHRNQFTDILTGFFYLNWMPVPIAFAIYLYFKNKKIFLDFSFTFLIVNLLGFVLYYIYPAAPPWYVMKYGFELQLKTQGDPGMLSTFDQFFGLPVFKTIYSRNSNIFAAFPSLHAAYPLLVLHYSLRLKNMMIIWAAIIFMMGIWFSAVYNFHHYFIDIIGGMICTLIAVLCFKRLSKFIFFKSFFNDYLLLIS